MAQSSYPDKNTALTRNVMNFMTMLERLDTRGAGLPGMGCFYGPSGFGKTWATIYAANQYAEDHRQLCLVQVESSWTKKALCEAILEELGIKAEKVVYKMARQIQEFMAREGAPLIVDEADHLLKHGDSVELLRDIYEKSHAPVILVGEEALPHKLRKWERVNSRLLARVAAEPIDEMDFDQIARLRLPELAIAPDLGAQIREASRGSARLICNNLDTLEMECRVRGIGGTVTADQVGKIDWHTGIAPDMRRFV